MSLSISFVDDLGTDGSFQLASAGGWKLVAEWAEGKPCIRTLCDYGKFKGTDKLAAELEKAEKPPSGDLAHTLEELIILIGVGDPGETAYVHSD